MAQKSAPGRPFQPNRLVLALAACFASAGVQALPTGAQVVNGAVTMNQVGQVLTITNSNGAIINWQSFSIGSGEITRFVQSSAASSVLNRVVTQNPSQILGQLQSNGQVFLINPAGIMVGAGAVIDVGSFVASSLQLSDADFLAGRFQFQATSGAGAVRNDGTIRSPGGGSVYLVAPLVENRGTIEAPGGNVLLAAGQTVQIGDTATPGVQVEITGSDTLAANMGTVLADAGRIGVVGALVKNSGTLSASSAVSEGGRVFLRASRNVDQAATGRIEADGTRGGAVTVEAGDTVLVDGAISAVGNAGAGGAVRLLGDKVGLVGAASVDASGLTGGGSVLVGGDYQGKNTEIRNASYTWFGADSTIKADAKARGNGGKVILWADDATRAYGRISARGGAEGGNGGFAEVSGKNYLDFLAYADLRSPKGSAGTLLLDPSDVTIVGGSVLSGGSFSGNIFSSGGSTSTIGWDTLISQLASGNVAITTSGTGGTGKITISGSPTGMATGSAVISHAGANGSSWSSDHSYYAYSSGNDLSFLAHGDIQVNSSFANAGTGAIRLAAGWDGVSTTAPAVTAGTGSIYFNNAGNSAVIANVGGDIDLQAGNLVRLQAGGTMGGSNKVAGIDMGAGALTVTANSIEVLGGAASGYADTNNRAFIQGNGSQTFNVTGGHLWVKGGGDAGDGSDYGNDAWIGAHGGGSQTINVAAGGDVVVQGGNGNGADYTNTGSGCPTSGPQACSNNRAEIRVEGSGNQTIAFAGAGTLQVIGGTSIADRGGNSAEIGSDGGVQTISGNAAITITSGAGAGGFYVAASGKSYSNEAGIFSDGIQNISGSSLALDASGTTGVGGAFLVGENQTINISGNISLAGGSSNTPSDYGFSSGAVIGYDGPSTINITAGGAFNMSAGNGAYGSAYVGTVNGTSDISITAQGIALGGGTGAWAGIGARDGSAADIHLTATSSGGFSLQGRSELLAGSGQIVMDHNVAGGASVTQAALSRIVADRLEVNGKNGISLAGPDNRVNTVALQTVNGNISYTSNTGTVHVDKAVTGSGNISLGVSTSGNNLALGEVQTSSANTVTVAAKGAILDDNGTGTANIKAGTITLSVVDGNPTGIAISADVDAPGGTVNVTVPASAGDGGIRIHSVGTSAPTSVTLTDATTTGWGDVSFTHEGDLTSTTGYSLSSQSGSVFLGATGDLAFAGGTVSAPLGSTALSAGSDLTISSSLSVNGDLWLEAGNGITINGFVSNLGAGSTDVAAETVTVGSAGALKSDAVSLSATTLNLSGLIEAADYAVVGANQVNVSGSGVLKGDSVAVFADSASLAGTGKIQGTTSAIIYASQVDVGAGAAVKADSVVVAAGNLNVSGTVEGISSVDVFADQATISGGTVKAIQGDVVMDISGNLAMYGGTISAGNEVSLALLGETSTLSLNSVAAFPVAKIVSGTYVPTGAIVLDFFHRSSDAVIINGVPTLANAASGTGFYNGATPAVRDAGLFVNYWGSSPVTETVTKDLVASTINSTSQTNTTIQASGSEGSTGSTSVIPAPQVFTDSGTGTSTGGTVTEQGEFGGGVATTSGGSASAGNSKAASKDGNDGKSGGKDDGKNQQNKAKQQRRNVCT